MKSGIHFFDCLPIHPRAYPLESFTGYLTRLAEINGFESINPWTSTLLPSREQGIQGQVSDFPPLSFGWFLAITHCTEEDLRATTFFYIGRKFGRSTVPQHVGRFLQGSIASCLRYCPQCLAEPEHSFYSLVWRFSAVKGCHIHGCGLLDQCPQCERSIPLFVAPLRIGICPFCACDLRNGASRVMRGDLGGFSAQTQDITFLLQPHELEPVADRLLRSIGKQIMRARQSQDLSRVELAHILQMSTNHISGIESGNIWQSGLTLQRFMRYTIFFGMRLSTLFATAIQEYQSAGGNSPYQAPERSSPLGERREQELLMRVQHVEQVLRKQNILPTPQAISSAMQVDVADLRYYPAIRQHLNQLLVEQSIKDHPLSSYHIRESELIQRVLNAVEVLIQQGKTATQTATAEVVGMTPASLTYYPAVRTLMKEICWEDPYPRDKPDAEDTLLTLIQHARETLRAQGKPVSQAAVCRFLRKAISTLRYYPRVRLLLEQIVTDHRKERAAAVSKRELELLERVQQAIEQLRSEGCEVTQHAIRDRVGVALPTLRRFAQVRSLLQAYALPRTTVPTTKPPLDEDELMVQVLQAIDELRFQGELITQQAIGKLVGMTPAGLRRYPQVKAILATLATLRRSSQLPS